MSSCSEEFHVLIIGAGITGLLIAQGLKKAGICYSIFEAEPSASLYRPREWSMALHWSLPLLINLLPDELGARLAEVQVDPSFNPPEQDHLKVFDGISGKVMKTLPVPKTMRAQRRRMRSFCAQGIDVNYGYELKDVVFIPNLGRDSVVATFKNGKVVRGSVIVGCDGPHSKLRELLVGPENAKATPIDLVHCNVTTSYRTSEQAKYVRSVHPIWCLAFYPEIMLVQTMHDVPDANDPLTWKFQFIISWPDHADHDLPNSERLAQVKSKAALLCEPFRSAFAWMPEDTVIRYNTLSYWVSRPWGTREGRAALAGDSAHPMPPHRGQGLNHAICDANNFVEAIKKFQSGESTLKQAMESYTSEVVERGAAEVRNSVENADMVYHWDLLTDAPIMQQSLGRVVEEQARL